MTVSSGAYVNTVEIMGNHVSFYFSIFFFFCNAQRVKNIQIKVILSATNMPRVGPG